jgi:vancomycin permeability regulator SanA
LLRTGCAAGALVLLAGAGLFASNAWVAHAAKGRSFDSVGAVPARSVAIVPGSRVFGSRPSAPLRGRLETALMLYQGGRVKKILVSGNDTPESPEASVMSAWLRERGVDPADILVDAGGSRTRETMDRAAGVFEVNDAVICTQDVNVPRSLYLADAAGIDAVAVGVPSTLAQSTGYMRAEALKTTLAYFESLLGGAPSAAAERARRAVTASR